jgi:predicted RND superfamily exporter protein
MKRPFYAQYSLSILAIILLFAPVVSLFAMRAMQHSSNDVADWLPESFESTRKIHWFAKHFVSDDFLMVSWEGCTLSDPRLAKLAEALRKPMDLPNGQSLALVRQVFTGPELVERFRSEPLKLSRRAAKQRLHGWLLGEETGQTALVAMLTSAGWEHREFFIHQLYSLAEQTIGIGYQDLKVAGSTVDSVAIDEASHRNLNLMMGACYLVSCLLMGWLFRDWVLTLGVFLTALFCQQVSLALVELTGGHVDSVMLMIPSLVYVLSVSAGVHLVNYYRDDFAAGSPESAVTRAASHALLPCLLAAVTTALGLGSLSISLLTPVRNFGLYAALGVLASVLVVFMLLPALLQGFSLPQLERQPPAQVGKKQASRWDIPFAWVEQGQRWVMLAGGILLGVGIWGVLQIQTSARVHDLFSAQEKLLVDYDSLERQVGPLVPLEVVVRMPISSRMSKVSLLDRMRIVGAIQGTIKKHPQIGAVLSALNFSASIGRRQRNALAVSREAVLEHQLAERLADLQEVGFLKQTDREQLWRISARAFAGERCDYEKLLSEISQAVEPVLARNADRGLGKIEVVYCGGVPLVQQTQQQMLRDLIKSFAWAFALIAAMMILLVTLGSFGELLELAGWIGRVQWVAGRVVAGLVAMIPNVMPCVVVLGGMGLAGIELGIGAIMTASVALGIAVDDTLHFITWFRRGMDGGKSRAESVRYAVHRCATAMTQTSLICGLGMLSFSVSDFVPMSRFAWLMFSMLLMALVADLVILPAILLGPLGKFFEPLALRQFRKQLS